MAINLANLYALLRRSFPEYSTIYSSPVSYLQTLTGQTNKVIFVYKEEPSKSKYISNLMSSKLNIKQDDNLNLTGSPLKDDCFVDALDMSTDLRLSTETPWSAEEEYYKGLPVNVARSILCDFNLQKEATSCQGSVWILCDGSDEQKTVLMEMEFQHNLNIRGIVTFKGIIPTSAVKSQNLFEEHSMLMSNHSKIDTQIDCFFNIKSNICLKVSWATSSLHSFLSNLKKSDVVLFQTFSVSDCSSLTEEFLNQLKILTYIKDDIVEFKEVNDVNKEPLYRCGRGIEMEDLKDNILGVMTELSGFLDTDGTCFEIEAVVQRAKERTLTDLTDKLWEILKCSIAAHTRCVLIASPSVGCSTYKDLKQAMNYVFQCAAKCNIVNLPANHNRLAEIINGVSQHRLAIPCLSGSEPLELLIEIGLEKLYKDYEYIFTESKLCSSNDLKAKYEPKPENVESADVPINVRKSIRSAIRDDAAPTSNRKTFLHSKSTATKKNRDSDVVGFQNSKFIQNEVESKLARLLQIHLALEHLLLIQINLNLENVYSCICEQLLKKSPQSFKAIDESLVDKIEIPIAADCIVQHLEGKDPNSRKVTLLSKNAFREVQSTFYYSMENIYPSTAAECYQTDDKEMIKDNIYFCWNYTKIKTRRA